jgi:hypothetical protein
MTERDDLTVPYTKAATIDRFFEIIETKRPPDKVDKDWAKSYELEPNRLSSIPTLLRWLGVIDANFIPDKDKWEGIRHADTRSQVLSDLIRDAYSDLFDAAEVQNEDRDQLMREFSRTYELGDAGERVTCFLKLCEVAGLEMSANSSERNRTKKAEAATPDGRQKQKPTRRKLAGSRREDIKKGSRDRAASVAVNVTLDIQVPADWSEEQVKERMRAIAAALEESGLGEA